jgi:hypothetical protein
MALSYSFHVSNQGHAISSCSKLNGVSKHNERKYKSKDYDRNKIDIIFSQTGRGLYKDVQAIYHDEFDEAVQKYNDKQTREDRKIKDYIHHVSDSKNNDVAVEIIIQLGDAEYWKDKDMDFKRSMKLYFEDQLERLKREMPDFKIANAVIHYDEKSPHMHVVGVPVAHGYKRGLEVRCSKTQIFTKKTLSRLQDVMRINPKLPTKMLIVNRKDPVETKPKKKGRNFDFTKQELDEYTKEHLEREKHLEELDQAILQKEKEIAELGNSAQLKEKDIALLNDKIEHLKSEQKKDERGLEDVKSRLALYEKRADEAQEQFNQFNEKLPAVRQELISAHISAQKAQEENTKLKEENALLEDDNKALRQEQKSLQQEIKDLQDNKSDLQNDVQKWQNSLDQLKGAVAKILNSASENFKKIILLHTKSQISSEKAVEFTEKTRQLHSEKIDRLDTDQTIKEKSKAIIDEGADEVQEYIRPRRRGR